MSREGERERVFKRNHGNNKGASISCPLTHTPDSRRETALSRTEIIRHFNHPQTSYVFIPKILPLLTLIFSSFPPVVCAKKKFSDARAQVPSFQSMTLLLHPWLLSPRGTVREQIGDCQSWGHREPLLMIHLPGEALMPCVEKQKESAASSTTV